MFSKTIFIILLVSAASADLFSQKDANEYEPPEVVKGSNLFISAYPYISASKGNSVSPESVVNYYVDLGASYKKWRYSRSLDYILRVSAYGFINKNESNLLTDLTETNHYSRFSFNLLGNASRYIIKDKLYTGLYAKSNNFFSSEEKPSIYLSLNPNIGYGRVVDAYVVNQSRNIEDVLIREGFTSSGLSRKVNRMLNNLLDKRDMGEFFSKYHDDDEVEFFTNLEKLLLDEKVIDRPLNARATMKIYQSLHNQKFILFPLLKGWNIQGELGYTYGNTTPDTAHYPVTLTISGLYGIPLNRKASLLFSSAFAFL